MTTPKEPPDRAVILHLGLGSFHRAHQAVYLDRLREQGGVHWDLVGGNLRDDMPDVMAALARQGGQYTLETVSPQGQRQYRHVNSIREVVPFDASLKRIVQVGADSRTHIISFTVTEAGYYLDAQGGLDTGQRDLRADLETGSHSTIYAALALILGERLQRGGGPITLLSCDNLRSNGARFRAGFLEFLALRGLTGLRAWVERNTSCPSSMVDRITPRPLPAVADRVHRATGRHDAAALMCESFTQWVIEDDFIAGRPPLEAVGVEFVACVHAHEEAKIRLLNATHSCLAWAGTLHGCRYIHESVAVPEIRCMAHDYVTLDAIACLDRPSRPSPIDLAVYRDVVLDRFSSIDLPDTNQRVATDSYSKMPGFIIPTIKDCVDGGRSFDSAAMLPALLFMFLQRWHRGELPYAYEDSAMDADKAHALFTVPDPLHAFCHDAQLWGDLAGNEPVLNTMRSAQRRAQAFALQADACVASKATG
jgi:D-arabinitol 4-dehydrogenase